VIPGRISPEPEDRRPIRGAPPDWDDRGNDWDDEAAGFAGDRDTVAPWESFTEGNVTLAYAGRGFTGETEFAWAIDCLGFDESGMLHGTAI
jgi:hypothetical protein